MAQKVCFDQEKGKKEKHRLTFNQAIAEYDIFIEKYCIPDFLVPLYNFEELHKQMSNLAKCKETLAYCKKCKIFYHMANSHINHLPLDQITLSRLLSRKKANTIEEKKTKMVKLFYSLELYNGDQNMFRLLRYEPKAKCGSFTDQGLSLINQIQEKQKYTAENKNQNQELELSKLNQSNLYKKLKIEEDKVKTLERENNIFKFEKMKIDKALKDISSAFKKNMLQILNSTKDNQKKDLKKMTIDSCNEIILEYKKQHEFIKIDQICELHDEITKQDSKIETVLESKGITSSK